MRKMMKRMGHRLVRIVLLMVLMLTMTMTNAYAAEQVADTTTTTTTSISELKTQNELLQQRSRFTTGSVAMILGIVALLAFLAVNGRWTRRLEIKNQQLQRERNVVVAQNKQLAIERDRAEAASRAKTSFIQSMTHEIRTPLNAINGFTQVLTMPGVEIPEEERTNCCKSIEENTRLLTKILDDLIYISDMESNTERPAAEACLAGTILEQAIDVASQLVAPTVKLQSECTIPADQLLQTYPQHIHTILNKLLDNAAKFTQQGTITLRLSQTDSQLLFTVADTGCGIPADQQDAIFERFSKLNSYSQGAGLGLAIARMTAEHLGGSLTLDTSYTGGAKFDLIVPINHA